MYISPFILYQSLETQPITSSMVAKVAEIVLSSRYRETSLARALPTFDLALCFLRLSREKVDAACQ